MLQFHIYILLILATLNPLVTASFASISNWHFAILALLSNPFALASHASTLDLTSFNASPYLQFVLILYILFALLVILVVGLFIQS